MSGDSHHQSRFDAKAATWDDDPEKVLRAGEIAAAVRDAAGPTTATRLLEYGAGTALVTQALLPALGPVTLADSSAGMREVMRRKVSEGLLPAGTRVTDLDLEHAPAPEAAFDLVVCALVLHHVHALERVLAGFASALAPGGLVAVADLDAEDGSFHDDSQHDFDGHHGFDREALAEALREAGLVDVLVQDCTQVVKEGRPYGVFLATARRPQ